MKKDTYPTSYEDEKRIVNIDLNLVSDILKPAPLDAHKGDMGRSLIFSGYSGMAGSAVLSASACMRGGTGLCFLASKEAIRQVVQISVPEVICISPEMAFEQLDEFDVVAIGPGMGKKVTLGYLKRLLSSFSGAMILDADALNVLAEKEELKELIRETSATTVVTPHMGEAARLLEFDDIKEEDRETVVQAIVAKYKAVSVLKGAGTLVYAGKNVFYKNTTGNPGMATAGSGDVLTGLIAALAGRGISPLKASIAGVYIHGRAGDLAAEEKGEYGMISRDIIEKIPVALKETLNCKTK